MNMNEWVDGLFEAIKHGDAEHQNWLRSAMTQYSAAQQTPAPVPCDPAELESLRRDAARYRWLRDSSNDYANDIVPVILVSDEKTGDDMLAEEKLDAAIDAALAANGEKGT